ncbi:transient receptor potential cation channel subfamily M member-like 2 [Clytia hemisphaerica]|uniref:Uncharacterized protein n=1 Tax=Clytia hemisphaerica TaxID=252671 RepID=A0A7M5V0U9_9CNID
MSDQQGEEEISMDVNPLVTPIHHQDHPSPGISTEEYLSSNDGENEDGSDEVFTALQPEPVAEKQTDFIKPESAARKGTPDDSDSESDFDYEEFNFERNEQENLWYKENTQLSMLSSTGQKVPTNFYGEINAYSLTRNQPINIKYIKIAYDTPLLELRKFLLHKWCLDLPILVVSLIGDSNLQTDAGKAGNKKFCEGMLKISKTPRTWFVSDTDYHLDDKFIGKANIQHIGIAHYGSWRWKGHLEGQQGRAVDDASFDGDNHTHYLLIDDGRSHPTGVENKFRIALEEKLMSDDFGLSQVITLAMGGGNKALKHLSETLNKGVPALILKQTTEDVGPNLLARALEGISASKMNDLKKSGDNDAITALFTKEMEKILGRDDLTQSSSKSKKSKKSKKKKAKEAHRKVSDLSEGGDDSSIEDAVNCLSRHAFIEIIYGNVNVDEAILNAFERNAFTSTSLQDKAIIILLYVLWARGDEFRKNNVYQNLFQGEGQDGQQEEILPLLFLVALALNRVEFLRGFEEGIVDRAFQKFSTADLEFLYWYRTSPYCNDKIGYLASFLDLSGKTSDVVVSLEDAEAGETFCFWTCTPGKQIRLEVIEDLLNNLWQNMAKGNKEFSNYKNHVREEMSTGLFIWAVLNGMIDMALFLITMDNEECSKSLVAAELCQKMADTDRVPETDYQRDVYRKAASTFQHLAVGILEEGYEQDASKTRLIAIRKLDFWTDYTCADLAINSEQVNFVANPIVNTLMDELWYGPLAKHINFWNFLLIFVNPLWITQLEFKNDEQLTKLSNGIGEIILFKDWSVKRFICGAPTEKPDDKARKRKSYAVQATENPETKTRGCCDKFFYKLYLFYFKTPIVKFFFNLFSYVVFLAILSITVLQATFNLHVTLIGWILLAYIISMTTAEIKQAVSTGAVGFFANLKYYLTNFWNFVDLMALLLFYIGFVLERTSMFHNAGSVILAIDAYIFIIRLLPIFYNFKGTGPYVFMIQTMLRDMMKFLAILLVFALAHGVCFNAIMRPQPISISMLRDIVFQPYFNIYGELFFENDFSDSNTVFNTPKRLGYENTIGLIMLALYMLIGNVLLLNLLIAIFGSIYEEVSNNAKQIWAYQRYELILEYANKSIFTPPFSGIQHIFEFIKWILVSICNKCCKRRSFHRGNSRQRTTRGTLETTPEGNIRVISHFQKILSPEVDREIDSFESDMVQRCLRTLNSSSNSNTSEGIDESLLIDISNRLKGLEEQIKLKLNKDETSSV